MNTFVVEDFFVEENNECNFYTVHFDGALLSETDKFYKRILDLDDYLEDLNEIHTLIENIAIRGTHTLLRQRNENLANALPPKLALIESVQVNYIENNLRLYYVLLSDKVIVLFNGGIKENVATVQESEASFVFYEAQKFAKLIIDAVREGIINIKGNSLSSFDGREIII